MGYVRPTAVQGTGTVIGILDALITDQSTSVSWSTVPDNSEVHYTILDSPLSSNFEWGKGTKVSIGGRPVLKRYAARVLGGTNGPGALTNFSGSQQLIMSGPLGDVETTPNVASDPSNPVRGQLAYRTDIDELRVYAGSTPSWSSLVRSDSLPGFGLTSFNGRRGAITLGGGDVTTALGNADIAYWNTAQTWTALQTFPAAGVALKDQGTHRVTIKSNETLSADRTLNVVLSDGNRTLDLMADATVAGMNTGDQLFTLTGPVTGSGSSTFATAITDQAITYSKIQNVSAPNTILGRKSGGAGPVEECTLTQVLDFGSAAQGDILYRGATSWTKLNAGADGQILKTKGPTANPMWASLASCFPLSDATVFLADDSDSTKRARFEVSGVSPGATRVVSIPNYDLTLAGLDSPQTFTDHNTFNILPTFPLTLPNQVLAGPAYGANPATPGFRDLVADDFDFSSFVTGHFAFLDRRNQWLDTQVFLQEGLLIKGLGDVNGLILKPAETYTAIRTLSLVTGDANRTLTLTGDGSVEGVNTGDVSLFGQNYLQLSNQQLSASSIRLDGPHVDGYLAAARFPALLGDVTTSAGSLTTAIGSHKVTRGMQAQGAALSVIGVTGSATADVADIAGTADQSLRVNHAGTALAFGAVDLSQAAAVTGVLQAGSFPMLTGDVTTVAGALATTLATTQPNVHTWSALQTFSISPSAPVGGGSSANEGFGLGALNAVTSGTADCSFGSYSGYNITSGAGNTTFGNSVGIGISSGVALTTGNYNTLFGQGSDCLAANTSYCIAFGNNAKAGTNEFAISPRINSTSWHGLTTGTVTDRKQLVVANTFPVDADGAYTSRITHSICDFNSLTGREVLRMESDGTNGLLSFHGASAVAQDTGWAPTNVSTDRVYDANSTSLDEIADVLGTLITKLVAKGVIGG